MTNEPVVNSVPQETIQNPPNKSKSKLLIGLLFGGCLVFIVIVIVVFSLIFFMAGKTREKSNSLDIGGNGQEIDGITGDVDEEPFDSGQFLPKVHGFSFPNYANDVGVTNLTTDEMYEIFGPGVCLNGKKEGCRLNSVARTWMNEVNETLEIGHCAGFTILSNFLKSGYVDPEYYGADNAYSLSFNDSELQADIAKWASYQFISRNYTQSINSTSSEVLDILSDNIPGDGYMLLIYQPGYTGGHAVTPTRVIDDGAGKYRIGIYDNNIPGVERYIDVDKSMDKWSYYATINPGYPEAEYAGNSSTETLLLVDMKAMKNKPSCGDKCSSSDYSNNDYDYDSTDFEYDSPDYDYDSTDYDYDSSDYDYDNTDYDYKMAIEHQVIFKTNNEFVITDEDGGTFSYKDNMIEDKSESISFVPIVSGMIWNESLPPVVNLDNAEEFKLRIYKGEDNNADFTYINETYAYKMDKSIIVKDYADISIDTLTFSVTVDTKDVKPNNVEIENLYPDYDQTLKFEDLDFFDDIFEFTLDDDNSDGYTLNGLKNSDLTIKRSSAEGENSQEFDLKYTEEEAKEIDLYIHSSANPIMFEADMKIVGLIEELSDKFDAIYPEEE